MFVDACAIVSMMAGEDTADSYEAALLEAVVVEWLEARRIALREPGSPLRVLSYAIAVAEKHGIGKRYLSNFDCFQYAYAKAMRAPLLTLDRLLRETDVKTLP